MGQDQRSVCFARMPGHKVTGGQENDLKKYSPVKSLLKIINSQIRESQQTQSTKGMKIRIKITTTKKELKELGPHIIKLFRTSDKKTSNQPKDDMFHTEEHKQQ